MDNKTILKSLFSLVTYPAEDLVDFAETGKGYVGDDGAYGVWYRDGVLEVSCWTCGDESFEISLQDYLGALSEHVRSKGKDELKERVDRLRKENVKFLVEIN